jgi:hypothetical protein
LGVKDRRLWSARTCPRFESGPAAQRDSLNAQQHLPAHGRKHFDSAIGKPAEYYPSSIGLSQGIRRDLCSLLLAVKYITKVQPQ